MRPIDDAALLALGDLPSGGRFVDTERLLDAIDPVVPNGSSPARTLGEINRAVLAARASTIGAVLDAVVNCPACAEPVSLEVPIDLLIDHARTAPGSTVSSAKDGWQVTARMPTLRDLVHAARALTVVAARATVVERCIVHAELDGRSMSAADVPEAIVVELAERLDELDPLIDPQFSLRCPECTASFVVPFDAAAYVHGELSARARDLLCEVDALARRYGWTEPDILALPPVRRARYLELVG